MKAKVIKAFVCKETQIGYNEGSIYEAEKERINELQDLGYLGESEKEKPNKPPKTPNVTPENPETPTEDPK